MSASRRIRIGYTENFTGDVALCDDTVGARIFVDDDRKGLTVFAEHLLYGRYLFRTEDKNRFVHDGSHGKRIHLFFVRKQIFYVEDADDIVDVFAINGKARKARSFGFFDDVAPACAIGYGDDFRAGDHDGTRFQIGKFENAVHDGVFVFFERTAFRSDGDKGFDFFFGV